MRAKGHVFKYGDNVDTDVIIPARYLNSFDAQELASHAMVDIDPDFAKKVQPGDMIVANKNFGCGSSREHAPLCLKTAGVSCIIAETFARLPEDGGRKLHHCGDICAHFLPERNQHRSSDHRVSGGGAEYRGRRCGGSGFRQREDL